MADTITPPHGYTLVGSVDDAGVTPPPGYKLISTPTSSGAYSTKDRGAKIKGTPVTPAPFRPMESGVDDVTAGVQQMNEGGNDRSWWNPIPSSKELGGISKVVRGTGKIIFPFALAANPVSAVVGSAIGLPVGAGMEAGAKALGVPEGTSEFLGDVGGMAGGSLGVRAATKIPIPEKLTPRGMYASAIKIPPALKGGVAARDKIISTGLRERIPVSRSGFDKTGKKIEALLADDAKKIAASNAPDINPLDVVKPLNRLKPTFANQVNPKADLDKLSAVKSEFLRTHTTEAPYTKIAPGLDEPGFVAVGKGVTKTKQPISVAEAHAEKTGTYRQLRKKYGELGSAEVEGQKQLARGLKDEIIKRVPGLNGVRESELIALDEQLSRFIGREGNKNIVGLIPAVVGAGGGMMMGHGVEGGAAGLLGTMAVLAMDNPAIKSSIAIALHRAGNMNIRPNAASAATGAAASRSTSDDDDVPHFAKGGIIKRPTHLVDVKSGKVTGLMAEQGPELIVPLASPDPIPVHNAISQLSGRFRIKFPQQHRIRARS